MEKEREGERPSMIGTSMCVSEYMCIHIETGTRSFARSGQRGLFFVGYSISF